MTNLRIIAGKFGSRIIKAPPGHRTHPMGDRIRGALFNSLGDQVPGAKVLDAFAGSGAVGLEALSRGASHVTFVERDKRALDILRQNIAILGVEHETRIIKTTVENWLQVASDTKFDLIFADPPYHDPQFSTVQKLFGLLHFDALMVLSHPGRGEAPTGTNGVVVVDNRSYAAANLTFYRRVGQKPKIP